MGIETERLDNNLLYHYTPAAAGKNILSTQEFWLTHYNFLKDPAEFKLAFDFIGQLIDRKKAAQPKFEQTLDLLSDALVPPENLYLGCFCARPDNEFLWQEYADRERGLVLAFDAAILQQNFSEKVLIFDADYEVERFKKDARMAINSLKKMKITKPIKTPNDVHGIINYKKNRKRISEIWAKAFCLKTKNYRNEEEWRLVHFPEPEGMHSKFPVKNDKAILDLQRPPSFPLRQIIYRSCCDFSKEELMSLSTNTPIELIKQFTPKSA